MLNNPFALPDNDPAEVGAGITSRPPDQPGRHRADRPKESGVAPATFANDDFQLARFPVQLGLLHAAETDFQDAKTALRQEFRECSKWKRLRCRKVSVIAERERGTIFAMYVGSAVEFDGT